MITMYDSIDNAAFPSGGDAYAGYVDGGEGDQPNAAWVAANFPRAHHLSITIFGNDADCADVESGAMNPGAIAAWFARQVARGVARPVIYASVSVMESAVRPAVAALPGARSAVRLWTAHYQSPLGPHICGPSTCGELGVDADGTQWTPSALGRTLDQSLLRDDFFGTLPPVTDPTEAIVQQLPTLKLGATGPAVGRVQGLLVAAGYDLGTTGPRKDGIDKSFGPATDKGVRDLQAAAGITVDGVVGPAQTWPALLGVA